MRRLACLLVWLACLGSAAAAPPALQPITPERPRLFYVGLALYSEVWSENDVVELSAELARTASFELVPLIASNLVSRHHGYPIATDDTIADLVHATSSRAAPEDIVLVHISTHGAPGMLARKIGRPEPTAIPASRLARQLAPLANRRTVIIISACYSGSLIAPLASPRRIIIAAARSDRSSFGCGVEARHTFFGQAELRGFAEPHRSLRQVFAAIRQDVARMERAQRYRPSDPQVFVGAEMTGLYEAPLF